MSEGLAFAAATNRESGRANFTTKAAMTLLASGLNTPRVAEVAEQADAGVLDGWGPAATTAQNGHHWQQEQQRESPRMREGDVVHGAGLPFFSSGLVARTNSRARCWTCSSSASRG